MGKDPAFLFYPGDWLGGTLGMSFEEKGAYMDILMMQFNRGHMTEHMIVQVIGHLWDTIEVKFVKDNNNLYYNERLEEEQLKRASFVNSRKNNKLGKNQYSNSNKNIRGHMTGHMEDENEDRNKDSLSIKYKKDIIHITKYLNEKLGTQYLPSTDAHRKRIIGRLKEGFSVEDFKKVIDTKYDEWYKDSEMSKFLRPETLFCKKHFESYLNQVNYDRYAEARKLVENGT